LQDELCSSSFAVSRALTKMARNGMEPWKSLADEAAAIRVSAKIEATINIINEAQDKVVVFTDHRATQEGLLDRLEGEGIKATAFHGGLSAREKESAVKAFREDSSVLVSTESGAEGRNLQFCNVMINYDLPWNPMKLEQRIGRLHRLGQEREVFVFNLAARGTIEEKILDLLTRKIRMFELVIGELDLILGNLESEATFPIMLRKIWLESSSEEEMEERLDAFGEELARARDRFAGVKEAELIVSGIFE